MSKQLLPVSLMALCLLATLPLHAQLVARNQTKATQTVSPVDRPANTGSLTLRDALMQLKKQ